MRILITVPWAQRLGGAEMMLQGLLEADGQQGLELELVFFEHGPWAEELRKAGIPVHVIETGRLRELHRWLASVLRLARLLRARRPDLLLNWSAKTQLYGAPAALLAGMPRRVVWWQHVIPTRNWLDGLAAVLPTAAVGCSSHAAARAQQRLRPRRPTFVVQPGSPPPGEEAAPIALDLPSGVPIVGLVGRLQPWKGQDRLLRAQRILADRGLPMHTLLVGGDSGGFSTDYAGALAPLARELGLADRVTMTGEVKDAGPYIKRLDVLVNASDPEPFGIVILEGMARGVAVLAVDSGGPAEFVENERSGALARSGEPQALADALAPLLSSPELRARLARGGRERFAESYTTAAMRARFSEQLRAVLDGR